MFRRYGCCLFDLSDDVLRTGSAARNASVAGIGIAAPAQLCSVPAWVSRSRTATATSSWTFCRNRNGRWAAKRQPGWSSGWREALIRTAESRSLPVRSRPIPIQWKCCGPRSRHCAAQPNLRVATVNCRITRASRGPPNRTSASPPPTAPLGPWRTFRDPPAQPRRYQSSRH